MNGKQKPNEVIVGSAHGCLVQWQMAHATSYQDAQVSRDDRIQAWKKPGYGWLKCNMDAIIFFQ